MIIGSKHHHVLTTEGWEVVGPRYSTCNHTVMGSGRQLKRQQAEGDTPQDSDHLDHVKLGVGDSRTRSRGKGMEGVVGSKAPKPGSVPNDDTRYANGEANPVANPGAKKMGNGLDIGDRKPPAPRWCLQGLSKRQR
jgi:hypothetical protein